MNSISSWAIRSLSLLSPKTQTTSQIFLQTPSISNSGTSFLDHVTPISGFFGQTFLSENIPFIDIPDTNIQDVYYYRWSSLQRHLRYTVPGTGYIITEFMQPVGYAQALNTIDAAAGHQIDEARWLRDQVYDDDYILAYTRGPANSTQYTHWILDAMFRRSQVNGDTTYTTQQLSDMARLFDYWEYTYDHTVGLYYYTPNWDAQEFSLPGYIVAPNGGQLQYDGPNTYRPNHNAYMVANARAVALVAMEAGDLRTASKFIKISDQLENSIYEHLWDPVQNFFVDVIRPNNPNLTKVQGREEVGLFPFRFGVGLNDQFANASVQELFDPLGLFATYGPTTLEIRNPYYSATKPGGACCYWNGQSWPFSTSHVLKSLAAIYRSTNCATAEQYVQYLERYATTQHKNGVPYIAESHYPSLDEWSADNSNHSEHYQHSTNNDDVITGLLGIIPRSDNFLQVSPIIPQNWTYFAIENLPYHGHLITVLYDQDGSRYNVGPGITIFCDGSKVYNRNSTSAQVYLPAAPIVTTTAPINIAGNPIGLGAYPLANATNTFFADSPWKAIDGYLFYDSEPDNRWTNYLSASNNDTLKITFARSRNISSVTLALFSDVARGGGIDVPARLEIYGSTGLLANVSGGSFLPNDRNTFSFAEVETQFVSVNLFRKSGVWVGLCELEVWVQPDPTPRYYAVDTLLTGASVMVDRNSVATPNGAVVGGLGSGSVVAFSGIESVGGKAKLTLSYANAGSTTSVEVTVNQVSKGTFRLRGTGGKYVSMTMTVALAGGRNFISLLGGTENIRYETLDVQAL